MDIYIIHLVASHLISYYSVTHCGLAIRISTFSCARRARSTNSTAIKHLNIFRTSPNEKKKKAKRKKRERKYKSGIFSNSIWNVTFVLAAPFYVLFNTHTHTNNRIEIKRNRRRKEKIGGAYRIFTSLLLRMLLLLLSLPKKPKMLNKYIHVHIEYFCFDSYAARASTICYCLSHLII